MKYLFGSEGNEELLLDFINDVLVDSGFNEIAKVEIKNPFNHHDFPTAKQTILDVKAEDEVGRKIQIEIQSTGQESHKHRVLYYWAKVYSDQLNKGDQYDKLRPVISINVLNFDLLKSYPEFHSLFKLTKSNDPELVLTDHLYIHFLELPKYLEQQKFTPLEKWMYYLKFEGERDMKIVIQDDPIIAKAHEKYVEFTQDKRMREIYEGQIEYERRYLSDLEEAKIEAEIKGKIEGKIEGKMETAKEMLAEGSDKDFISRVTGLSLEEIEKLAKE